MTYQDCIPLVHQLNHSDKLRLVQWMINQIAVDEGVVATDSSGFCGIWQDSHSSEEIVQDIYASRSASREIKL